LSDIGGEGGWKNKILCELWWRKTPHWASTVRCCVCVCACVEEEEKAKERTQNPEVPQGFGTRTRAQAVVSLEATEADRQGHVHS